MATSCGLDLARNLESMGIRVGMQGLSSDADNEAVNASGVYPSINLVTVPSRRQRLRVHGSRYTWAERFELTETSSFDGLVCFQPGSILVRR